MTSCQPPDPDTRNPGIELPAGACDAHCHIFGPAHRFPYAEGRTYTPPDAPVEDFRRLQHILGFERAVIVQASCGGTAVWSPALRQSRDNAATQKWSSHARQSVEW